MFINAMEHSSLTTKRGPYLRIAQGDQAPDAKGMPTQMQKQGIIATMMLAPTWDTVRDLYLKHISKLQSGQGNQRFLKKDMPCGISELTVQRIKHSTKEQMMSTTVTMDEAQAHLPELIEHLQPGEEMTITRQGEPLALRKTGRTSWPCQAGTARIAFSGSLPTLMLHWRILRSTWSEPAAGHTYPW